MCGVKPYVLRYWEQEFTQLKPMKRRGNRRYYQHHEVLLIRRIRELLYEQGFTISGARNRLTELVHSRGEPASVLDSKEPEGLDEPDGLAADELAASGADESVPVPEVITTEVSMGQMRQELISIRGLLVV